MQWVQVCVCVCVCVCRWGVIRPGPNFGFGFESQLGFRVGFRVAVLGRGHDHVECAVILTLRLGRPWQIYKRPFIYINTGSRRRGCRNPIGRKLVFSKLPSLLTNRVLVFAPVKTDLSSKTELIYVFVYHL